MKRVTLGSLGKLQVGGTPSRSHDEYFGGDIPWVSTVALGNAAVGASETVSYLTDEGVKNSTAKIVPAESLLIGIRVGVGKCSVTTCPMCTNQDIVALSEINEEVDPFFLKYVVDSYADWFNKTKRGATILGVTSKEVSKLSIPLPSLIEQHRVVDTFAKIDSSINESRKLAKKIDELAKSRFIEMFGNPLYSADTTPLSEVGYIGTGSTPSTKEAAYYSPEGLPFIKPGDLPEDSISLICDSETHLSDKGGDVARVFPVGTVLVTCIGTIGKVGISSRKGACNQQINYVISYDDVDCVYLAYCLLMCKTKLFEMANAPVVPIVNKTQFSSLKIPVPNLALQREFSVFVAQIDKLRFDALSLKESPLLIIYQKVRKSSI